MIQSALIRFHAGRACNLRHEIRNLVMPLIYCPLQNSYMPFVPGFLISKFEYFLLKIYICLFVPGFFISILHLICTYIGPWYSYKYNSIILIPVLYPLDLISPLFFSFTLILICTRFVPGFSNSIFHVICTYTYPSTRVHTTRYHTHILYT